MDLVIRNAYIYDGTGTPGFRGEIGVKDGRIERVGRVPERGLREIDAGGLAAAPGSSTRTRITTRSSAGMARHGRRWSTA